MSHPSPVRVIYCTSGGLYGALILERLLASPKVDVVGVTLSTRILRKGYGFFRGALAQVGLTGMRYSAYLWCATDLADLLAQKRSVRRRSVRHGIPLLATRDINAAAGVAFVGGLRPDLLLSGFFNQRLAPQLCRVPTRGAVNIHPGALPAFRGVDPVFHAMQQGSGEFEVSVHRVVEALDAGPVLARRRLSGRGGSLLSLTAQLFCAGADLTIENLARISSGYPGEVQTGSGRYDSWPTPEAVRDFAASGKALVRGTDLRQIVRGTLCAIPENAPA